METSKKPEAKMGPEKRVLVQVDIYFGPSPATIISALSYNLSTGGLFLQTDYPFKGNESVKLVFSLPNHEQSISCNARVAWLNSMRNHKKDDLPNGVGLEFIDLKDNDKVALSGFLDQNGN